jgi:hypothetical protein
LFAQLEKKFEGADVKTARRLVELNGLCSFP